MDPFEIHAAPDVAVYPGQQSSSDYENFLGLEKLFGGKKSDKSYDEEIKQPKQKKGFLGIFGNKNKKSKTANTTMAGDTGDSGTGSSEGSSDSGVGLSYGNLFGPGAKTPKSTIGLEYTNDFDLNRDSGGIGLSMNKLDSVYKKPTLVMPKLTDITSLFKPTGTGNNSTGLSLPDLVNPAPTTSSRNNAVAPQTMDLATPVQTTGAGSNEVPGVAKADDTKKKDNTKIILMVAAGVAVLGIIAIAATGNKAQQPVYIPVK